MENGRWDGEFWRAWHGQAQRRQLQLQQGSSVHHIVTPHRPCTFAHAPIGAIHSISAAFTALGLPSDQCSFDASLTASGQQQQQQQAAAGTMADDAQPLSNLPQLVPAAAFMEDVQAYMQGARRSPGARPTRRRRRRSTPLPLACPYVLTPTPITPPHNPRRPQDRGGADGAARCAPKVQVHRGRDCAAQAAARLQAARNPKVPRRRQPAAAAPGGGRRGACAAEGAGCRARCGAGWQPTAGRRLALRAPARVALPAPFLAAPRTSPTSIALSPFNPTLQTVLDFSLSDQVFARGKLQDVEAVNLWLGAGVMLEYRLEDARVGGWVVWSCMPCVCCGRCGCGAVGLGRLAGAAAQGCRRGLHCWAAGMQDGACSGHTWWCRGQARSGRRLRAAPAFLLAMPAGHTCPAACRPLPPVVSAGAAGGAAGGVCAAAGGGTVGA